MQSEAVKEAVEWAEQCILLTDSMPEKTMLRTLITAAQGGVAVLTRRELVAMDNCLDGFDAHWLMCAFPNGIKVVEDAPLKSPEGV